MAELNGTKRKYERPAIAVYTVGELWRQLGPAQALTSGAPSSRQKEQLPSNPLRIPPTK
jgi:hypothetical protein